MNRMGCSEHIPAVNQVFANKIHICQEEVGIIVHTATSHLDRQLTKRDRYGDWKIELTTQGVR